VTIEDILGGPGNVAGEAEGVRGELVRALAETATAYSRQVRGQRLVRDRRIRVAALLAVVLVAVCSGLACVGLRYDREKDSLEAFLVSVGSVEHIFSLRIDMPVTTQG